MFFDVCAKPEIVDAAKRGLKNAGIEKDRYLCVSVGIDGDPHITKAIIDSEKCVKCGVCKSVCPHDAIIEGEAYSVKKGESCFNPALTQFLWLTDFQIRRCNEHLLITWYQFQIQDTVSDHL